VDEFIEQHPGQFQIQCNQQAAAKSSGPSVIIVKKEAIRINPFPNALVVVLIGSKKRSFK